MLLGERVQRQGNRRGGTRDEEILRIVDGWYEIEEDGYQRRMPVLHFHGRTLDGEYRHFAVHRFRPYLLVEGDASEQIIEDLNHDRRVIGVRPADRPLLGAYGTADSPYQKAWRVETAVPWSVRDLREVLHDEGVQTGEADVLFPQRFLIDREIRDLCRVPIGAEEPLEASEVVPVVHSDAREGELPSIEHEQLREDESSPNPRICTWDLEVYTEGEFPEPAAAQQPVTAVSLHDSYSGEYETFALRQSENELWSDLDAAHATEAIAERVGIDTTAHLYDDERALLVDVIQWLLDTRPDVLAGWNNDSFDVPYFINRCFEIDLNDVVSISPTRSVDRHEDGGRFVNSDVTGIHVFDLLAAYKKSVYTQLQSAKLENVAALETDLKKLDVDEQDAWKEDPIEFLAYSARDVEATVRINENKQLL